MKKISLLVFIVVSSLLSFHTIYSYRKYNVILITIDTLRADFLSCYNPEAAKTPNIDSIAGQSVLFSRAHTQIPITLPAHIAMMTSHYPHDLGLFNNGNFFVGKQTMITDVLKEKGYHSAAFISLGVLKGSFGLGRGFNEYEDTFDNEKGRYYKVAAEINKLALPWFEKNRDRRFFAWLHYSDPHEPYVTVDAPPDTEIFANEKTIGKYVLGKKEKIDITFTARPGENKIEFYGLVTHGPKKIQIAESLRFLELDISIKPSDEMNLEFGPDFKKGILSTGVETRYFVQHATIFLRNHSTTPKPVTLRFRGGIYQQRVEDVRKNYAAEVQYVDKHVGELWNQLDKLGLLNNSIIILTADHGEGLKTHGVLGHVAPLYQETIRVPLIIYYPNLGKRGKVENPIVNHLDIMPTILDLLHVNYEGPMQGLSLKHYVSRSPIDWLTSQAIERTRTFTATYAPEAHVNSFSMVDGHIKLIHTPAKSNRQWEVYDLLQDGFERRNLASKDFARFNSSDILRLRAILEEFRRDAESVHSNYRNPKLNREDQEMLMGLGYIEGGS